jgi:hypothetical protein
MKQMLRMQNSAAMFLTHVSPASLIDGSASSRRIRIEQKLCRGSRLATCYSKALKWFTWQVNCLGMGQQAQSLHDVDDCIVELNLHCSRPASSAGLRIAALVPRSFAVALVQAHGVTHNSPHLPACLSSYVDIVPHRVYCNRTFTSFYN